jgi:solute carrier family 25 S-adenosylmethionine transporter 26
MKQRMQVFQYESGLASAVKYIYQNEGLLGFYRGFQATLQREIPFACLQFPLYEYLKHRWDVDKAWQAALCGSVAGGVTAALTTPLDVIKTRTMLSKKNDVHQYRSPWEGIRVLWKEGGLRRLFAGVGPRTVWISVGGFIFFGAYEKAKQVLMHGSSTRV